MIVYEIMSRQMPFTDLTEYISRREEQLLPEQLKDTSLIQQLEASGFKIEEGKVIKEEFQTQRIKTAIVSENLRPTISEKWPKFFQSRRRECWNSNPEKRPSWVDIIANLKEQFN